MRKCKVCGSDIFCKTISIPITKQKEDYFDVCLCESAEYAQVITSLAKLYNLTERFPEEKKILFDLLKGDYKAYQDKFFDMVYDIDQSK
jgi:hypothetical protein